VDFPKSVPSVGLVDGQFVDENPVAGTPGSLIPSAWGNAVTLELLAVIEAAGLTPDEDNLAQLLQALRLISRQPIVLADTGVANAYTAVNTPALTALPATGTLQNVKIANANTGASTYAPDGLAAKPIYGLGLQPLQGGELPAGVAVLMYLVQASVNGGNGAWIVLESLGGASQVAPASKSQHAVNAGQIQGQVLTAFTAAGAAPTFTLTPVPAIAAYAAGQRFRVKFNAASAGADTLNVSGLGAKNLKQYDSIGNKVPAVLAPNQLADVEYDGADMVVLDPLPLAMNQLGIQGSAKNLAGSATGMSAAVAYTADEIIVESAANTYQVLRGVNIAPSFANPTGANGLDVGAANSQAASTWYSVWVIWNGATADGLLSLSGNAPAMPAGYTHKARVGWVRTDATANKFPLAMIQRNDRASLVTASSGTNLSALPVMASGSNPATLLTVAVGAFAPPNAASIIVSVSSTVINTANSAGPNASYVQGLTGNIYPTIVNAAATGGASQVVEIFLESTNIYANLGGGQVRAVGWRLNL
jgi:hypothetical protein